MTWRRRNMAEGLDSSIERLEKLLRSKPFILPFLKQLPKFKESKDKQELVRSLISTFRKFQKDTMRILFLMTDSLEHVEIQKKSFLVFVKALCLHEASKSLGDGSLPFLYEDRVNNGRSNEGSHVSSGNNEGRLDDHSGSKDVRAGLISVPDGGGIEEPDRRETPGPITVISPTKPIKRRKSTVIPHGTDAHGTNGLESSVQPDNHVSSVPDAPDAADADGGENPAHGTDGLERFIQSVMEPKLWQVVDEWGSHGNWKRKLEELNLETDLSNTPSYSDRLKKITNNVGSEFPRLLQLRDRNPSLSSEDLKVYCVPLCWSSKKRVDFWSDLSDELFLQTELRSDLSDELFLQTELRSELERTWQLHFGGDWVNRMGRQDLGEKWFHKIDELWIINHGRSWFKFIDSEWSNMIEDDYMPRGSHLIFFRGLLRFIRNRQHHLDQFQKFQGFHSSVKSFYNYFDARFPNLLLVSYGVAYQFCRDEPWFKKYS